MFSNEYGLPTIQFYFLKPLCSQVHIFPGAIRMKLLGLKWSGLAQDLQIFDSTPIKGG
jgi:hypothetical protein